MILKKQLLVDVRLKAGSGGGWGLWGKTISAHKLVLSARSKVFEKMFDSDDHVFKTSTKPETITLSELKHTELEALVEFLYSDGSMLSTKAKEHVRSLYVAADKYEIPHLRDRCRNELIASLNLSNALNRLELAQIPFDKALNDKALEIIRTNMATICRSPELKVFVAKTSCLDGKNVVFGQVVQGLDVVKEIAKVGSTFVSALFKLDKSFVSI